MSFWILTDTHGNHDQLVNEGLRPKGFDEKIIKNLSLVLRPDDVLIHLGDVCWKSDSLWNKRLTDIPCKKKWLILGNHDGKSISWYINNGWDIACSSFTMEMFGKKILFSHIPQPEGDWDINIHGHFHDFKMVTIQEKEPEIFKILGPKHYLVSLENLKYQPIKLNRIIEERFNSNGVRKENKGV